MVSKRGKDKGAAVTNGGGGKTSKACVSTGGTLLGPADGEDGVVECRFKHLLEPIRDLALNWNIDIAQELEHYLGQLEQVQVTLDGGGTFLNFAEAALLIQGTTCVYSRKVEYLHRLVLQVLDVIDHKLSKELRKDAAADGDQDAEKDFPADPEFISLDDIPEAKSQAIDMVETFDDMRNATANGDTDLAVGPLVVMMNIEVDNDNPDPNKDLRLSSAMMHESGALLLDPCSASFIDMNLQPRKSLQMSGIGHSSDYSPERLRADDDNITGNILMGLDLTHGPSRRADDTRAPEVHPEIDYGADESDGDTGGGYEEEEGNAKEREGGGSMLKSTAEAKGQEEEDLWRVLDPHDASGHTVRSLKKGRSVRRPVATRADTCNSIDLWAKQTRSLKVPTLPEFTDVFLQERARLVRLRLAASRPRGGGGRTSRASAATAAAVSRMMDLADVNDDDDYHIPAPDGVDAGDSTDDDRCEADVLNADDFAGGDCGVEGEEVGYGGGGARGSSTCASAEAAAAGGGMESWDVLTYEQLCKIHIDKYLRGVEDSLHRSALESRVRDWRKKIEPALEAEEARRPFDIHEYGECVKSRLAREIQTTHAQAAFGFEVAVAGMARYDVCRAFLATLQLANDGNVDIRLADPHDNSSIRLKLLSSDSKHEEMVSTYIAPSVASARKKRIKISRELGEDETAAEDGEEEDLSRGSLTQTSQMPTQAAEERQTTSVASVAGKGRRGRLAKVGKENIPSQ